MTVLNTTTDLSALSLQKSPSGIKGLDEILWGGFPKGRVSLVCGGPGSGKTLLATEFLVRGASLYNEPGVFMAFEETAEDLAKNFASLGIDLQDLIDRRKIFLDYVYIERSEIEETGEYDLEGLFIRLASAIDAVGAKRVVLDTIETIFAGFSNESILRAEIRRLFRWLKDHEITAIVTGERGERALTRYGLEEYVSDCVLLLDNRVDNKMANRILRVVKYRGSQHGTDEYPFLIGDEGIWVEPISSVGLNHTASTEIVSTGVAQLDQMFAKSGYYRGSSVLVSGTAGTGKTSLAASFINAACQRGERCLYVAYEESTSQILRNMRSVGNDLEPWTKNGLLQFQALRSSFYSMEMHLLTLQKQVEEFKPSVVVIDPLSNLISTGTKSEVKSMLVRLIDFLKVNQITSMFTSLTSGDNPEVSVEVGVSSLMDTWLLVRNIESNGERNRALYILKSRGQAHSTQVREFRLTDHGIELVDVYSGPEGILTGSARLAQTERERQTKKQQQDEIERRKRSLERKRQALNNQIQILEAEFVIEEERFLEDKTREEEKLDLQKEEHQIGAGNRQILPGSKQQKNDEQENGEED